MSPANKSKPLIPYLRQSKKKEATISIEEQRRDIQRWAETAGVALAVEVQYAQDAEREGDQELASLFRRMPEHSRRGAEECKALLRQRLEKEET